MVIPTILLRKDILLTRNRMIRFYIKKINSDTYIGSIFGNMRCL